MNKPTGIKDLVGREPIAAALAVGRKGPSGAPIERDRFHVLNPSATVAEFSKRGGGTYNSPIREPHPSFARFNGAAANLRHTVDAVLAHATVKECFEYRLKAQTIQGITVPNKAPACFGDGERARRYDPKTDDYVDIECPHDRCQHRQAGDQRPAACKPWMRFLARFRFENHPNLAFKYESGSWNTVKAFVGFFESFERNCRNLGVEPSAVPLFGLPVVLQLQEKTNATMQRRFPVVTINVAGDDDLIGWIRHQQGRLDELKRLPSPARIIDVADEHDPDLISGPVGLGG